MPRFFIHIQNGIGDQIDENGLEFVNSRLAMAEAAKMAGDILCDEINAELAPRSVRLSVETEDKFPVGIVEMTVSLHELT